MKTKKQNPPIDSAEFWQNASPKECARAVVKLVRKKLYKRRKQK
jgi:hypothetical protein